MKDSENGFKETELGPLPEDWNVVKLGEVAIVKQGRTPKIDLYSDRHGYRIIKVKDFHDGGKVSVIPTGKKSFTTVDLGDSYRVKEGDILVLNAGHSAGVVGQKVGVVPPEIAGSFYVAELTVTRSLNQNSNSYFLFCCLMCPNIRDKVKSLVKGGHLYSRQLKTIPIPLPPLSEQERIAGVLSAIQGVIEKTEKVIRANRELKRSLMKHLFTYGPVPVNNVDSVNLKDTEIGNIPQHWNVVKLGEVCEVIMGQSPPGKTYNTEGNGVPFLQGKAEFGDIYPTHIKYTTKPLKIALPNTVLISVRAPVGDVNLTNIIYCIGRGLASLSLKNSNNFYLFYCLAYLKPLLEKQGTGSTFMAINKSKLERFPIPLPPLSEQERIVEVLCAVDEKIQAEERKKKSLEVLFRSMLHYLMSGKIRVNNLNIEG